MKKYLSTGFVILLPIALTVWIIAYLLDLFTDPLYNMVESSIVWYEEQQGTIPATHEHLVAFFSRTIAFLLTFLFVFLLGYCGRKFFFKPFLNITQGLLQKIPFIGTIYRLTKDVTHAMLSTDQKTFKQTVLIPFPSDKTHTVAFITGDVPIQLRKIIPSAEVTVFVPTAPHPISGYILFAPQSATHEIAISVEETFKFLLSCGVIQPKVENEH